MRCNCLPSRLLLWTVPSYQTLSSALQQGSAGAKCWHKLCSGLALTDALQTMAKLHSSGWSYGDFKPSNIRVGMEESDRDGAAEELVQVAVVVHGMAVAPIWVSITFIDMAGSFQGPGEPLLSHSNSCHDWWRQCTRHTVTHAHDRVYCHPMCPLQQQLQPTPFFMHSRASCRQSRFGLS